MRGQSHTHEPSIAQSQGKGLHEQANLPEDRSATPWLVWSRPAQHTRLVQRSAKTHSQTRMDPKPSIQRKEHQFIYMLYTLATSCCLAPGDAGLASSYAGYLWTQSARGRTPSSTQTACCRRSPRTILQKESGQARSDPADQHLSSVAFMNEASRLLY